MTTPRAENFLVGPSNRRRSTDRLALRSRRIITPKGLVDGVLVIEGHKIAEIRPFSEPLQLEFDRIEDLGELAILPGGIDPHVHLNEPGRTDWEGMETGTRAAAAGGFTTLVDMPLNSDPVTLSVQALNTKRQAALSHRRRSTLYAQLAFHGGLVPGHVHCIEPMLDAGAVGIKAFMTHSGIDDFPAATERELRPAMEILARRGIPLWVHAELETRPVVPTATHQDRNCLDRNCYGTWLASRPSRLETDAHELLIRCVRDTGCPLHIVHLATADALPALSAARAEGLPITIETSPHYLTFAAEELPDADPRFKCAPPIRGARHREALWRALEEGVIDFIASDHSPAPPTMKTGDLMSAWGGIASLQVALSATWTGAQARGFGLGDLARWTASEPAKLLGLQSCKGALIPGHDADLTIFDPDAELVVSGADLEHRHPETAYEGRGLRGRALRTYIQGQLISTD